MTIVLCNFKDSADMPLVGYVEVTRADLLFRPDNIGLSVPVQYALVAGSVGISVTPGRYYFRAYDRYGNKVFDKRVNVPNSGSPVLLSSLAYSTPITADRYDTSLEAVAIRLRTDETFIDAVADNLNLGGVLSFNGRVGHVLPASDDYSYTQITGLEGILNAISTSVASKVDTTDSRLSDARPASSASDLAIGDRTVDPDAVPSGNTGSLTSWLSWITNRLKAITGKSFWYQAPAISLETTKTRLDGLDNTVSSLPSTSYVDAAVAPLASSVFVTTALQGKADTAAVNLALANKANLSDLDSYINAEDPRLTNTRVPTNGSVTTDKLAAGFMLPWANLNKTGSAPGDIGAEVAGTAASLVSSHVNALDPHTQYVLGTELNTAIEPLATRTYVDSKVVPWEAPGKIGSITPNSASFTDITVTGNDAKVKLLHNGTIPVDIGTYQINGNENGIYVPLLKLTAGRFDFDPYDSKAEIRVSGSNTQLGFYNTSFNGFYFRVNANREAFFSNNIFTSGSLIAGSSNPRGARLYVNGNADINGVICGRVYTGTGALPSASTVNGAIAVVNDGANRLRVSDGDKWNKVAIGSYDYVSSTVPIGATNGQTWLEVNASGYPIDAWYYDSRWVSIEAYASGVTIENASVTQTLRFDFGIPGSYSGILLTQINYRIGSPSNHSGTAFWNLTAGTFSTAGTTQITSTQRNTQTLVSTEVLRITQDVNIELPTNIQSYTCSFSKTSTPGNIWVTVSYTSRKIR